MTLKQKCLKAFMRATFPEIKELLGASPLGYQLCPSLNPSRSPVGKVGDQLYVFKNLNIEEGSYVYVMSRFGRFQG